MINKLLKTLGKAYIFPQIIETTLSKKFSIWEEL